MNEREQQGLRFHIETQVNRMLEKFFTQKPCPSPVIIADFFGMYDLVQHNKRSRSTEIHIPALKIALVDRLMREYSQTGQEPTLPQEFEFVDRVLVPPGEGEIKTGSGAGLEEKEVFNRTQYLSEFLNKHSIQYDTPIAGKNTPSMMRGDHTYFLFFLPKLNITIFVNNQEGNATFLFYTVPDKEAALGIADLKKEEYPDLEKNLYPFQSLDWAGGRTIWEERLLDYLTQPVKENASPDKRQTKMSIGKLAESLDVAHDTIVRTFKALFPDIDTSIPNGTMANGRGVFFLSEEQSAAIRAALQERIDLKKILPFASPKDGDITIINLRQELGVNKERIIRLIEKFFPHVDRTKPNFLDPRTNSPTFFLSQEEADKIRAELKDYREIKNTLPSYKPELGENTIPALAKEMGVTAATVRSRVVELFPHLDLQTANSVESNRPLFRLLPEQVDIVRKALQEYIDKKNRLTRPPNGEGWIGRGDLAAELTIGYTLLKNKIDKLFPSLDTEENFLDEWDRPAFFLSKKQADIIRTAMKEQLPLVPENQGFISIDGLGVELQVNRRLVESRLGTEFPGLDITEPNFLNPFNRPTFYLDKSQADKVRRRIKERLKPVPENERWTTFNALAVEFGLAQSVVAKIFVRTYPDVNLDQFNFISETGKPGFYMDAEQEKVIRQKIVEYIKQKEQLQQIQETEGKDGRVSMSELAEELKVTYPVIRNRFQLFFPGVDIKKANGLNRFNKPTFYINKEQADKIRDALK